MKKLALVAMFAITIFSSFGTQNTQVSEKIDVEIKRTPTIQISNIAYKQTPAWFDQTKRNLEFTLVAPNNAKGKKLPLVIWVCGGSWKMMDRGALLPEFRYLADAGYIVAAVDYRLSNESPFPSQLEDLKAAIRYLKKHADEYGIDKERVAIMGASAGGHLSLLTAYTQNDKQYDVGDNLDENSHVKAVVDFYGPADFDVSSIEGEAKFYLLDLINLVGTPNLKDEKYKLVSPTSHIRKDVQPTIIFHGDSDKTVPVDQSRVLYEKLKEANVYTEYYEIKGADHGSDEFYQNDVNDKVLKFLEKFL